MSEQILRLLNNDLNSKIRMEIQRCDESDTDVEINIFTSSNPDGPWRKSDVVLKGKPGNSYNYHYGCLSNTLASFDENIINDVYHKPAYERIVIGVSISLCALVVIGLGIALFCNKPLNVIKDVKWRVN